MTDNEIIKALECCCDKDKCNQCPIMAECCFFYEKGYVDMPPVLNQTIDLINRQNAEIERLGELLRLEAEGANTLNDVIAEQQAEIERLGKRLLFTFSNAQMEEIKNDCLERIEYNINAIKSEAIKEFAERLKAETIEIDVSYGYGKEHYTEAVTTIAIDNLVKEMTEQSNE